MQWFKCADNSTKPNYIKLLFNVYKLLTSNKSNYRNSWQGILHLLFDCGIHIITHTVYV